MNIATSAAIASLAVLLLAAVWLALRQGRSRRYGRGVGAHLAAYASIALIVSLTLARDGWPQGIWPASLVDWSADGWAQLTADPFGSNQILLNGLLFVPAGVAWTWLTGRPWRVLLALAGLTVLVECLQAVFRLGAADPADLVANVAGAAIGVAAGAIVLMVWPHPLVPRPSGKRVAITAGLAVLGCVAALVGIRAGAAHRQETVRQEALARFAGTTLADFRGWETGDTLYENVFDAISVFSDGTRYEGSSVEVRYPASFLGLRRCVFVAWSPAGAEVRPGSGGECSELIG